jgi:uncharacterized membrane protein YccC
MSRQAPEPRRNLRRALWSRLAGASAREPGADLSRLPVGLDLRAISIEEGIRAAFACAAVILLNEWLRWPPLVFMALAANLACFCDVGGPIRRRLAALAAFTLIGALTWAGFGLLRPLGLWILVPAATAAIFCCGFARVWGVAAGPVGNVLIVVVVFGSDKALSPIEAALAFAMFLAGGVWAAFLALVLWRMHPYQPARDAVAETWRLIAELARDLRRLALDPNASAKDWDAHGRAHRRAVRAAVEQARGVVTDLIRARNELSLRGEQALIRLETGDQIFGALIALSDLLEAAGDGERRGHGARLLRILAALLRTLSRSIHRQVPVDLPRIEASIESLLEQAKGDAALTSLAIFIAERLRIAVKLSSAAGMAGRLVGGEAPPPWRERILGPVRANLTWDSAVLRHAARAAVIGGPTLLLTLLFEGTFTHWLTITVVLTMQPYFAATWQRAVERVGGTVVGGLVGTLAVHFAQTPLELAALLFPLSIVGFSARQVSYGAFIACLTPLIIVLVELLEPGHGTVEVMLMRSVFTVAGGVMAIAGNLLLWPSWEPERLAGELTAALAAHGRYAQSVLAERLGEGDEARMEAARGAAGVATNNLEASLSRLLQEQHRIVADRLEATMVADATLRRFAARLAALRHEKLPTIEPATWREWQAWIAASFDSLAGDAEPLLPRPASAGVESLDRLARQVELLEVTMKRLG